MYIYKVIPDVCAYIYQLGVFVSTVAPTWAGGGRDREGHVSSAFNNIEQQELLSWEIGGCVVFYFFSFSFSQLPIFQSNGPFCLKTKKRMKYTGAPFSMIALGS
jgi:hypothetical protein